MQTIERNKTNKHEGPSLEQVFSLSVQGYCRNMTDMVDPVPFLDLKFSFSGYENTGIPSFRGLCIHNYEYDVIFFYHPR